MPTSALWTFPIIVGACLSVAPCEALAQRLSDDELAFVQELYIQSNGGEVIGGWIYDDQIMPPDEGGGGITWGGDYDPEVPSGLILWCSDSGSLALAYDFKTTFSGSRDDFAIRWWVDDHEITGGPNWILNTNRVTALLAMSEPGPFLSLAESGQELILRYSDPSTETESEDVFRLKGFSDVIEKVGCASTVKVDP